MERSVATSALPCVSGFWRIVAKPLSALITLAAPATAFSFPVIQFSLPSGYAAMPAAAVAVAARLQSAGSATPQSAGSATFVSRAEPQSHEHAVPTSSTSREPDSDWNSIQTWTWGDLREQLSGSLLTPGETFSFTPRSLRAPELQYGAVSHPDYSVSRATIAFVKDYTDIFAEGRADASGSPGAHGRAPSTLTLGNIFEPGSQMLAQLCIVNRSTHAAPQGGDGCKTSDANTPVPTPPLLPLMGIGLLGIGLARRRG